MKYYNKSLEGSSHKGTGLPCQDFSLCERFETNQKKEVIIMAISDGHGSKTYVRSHVGSQLACTIAINMTKQFVEENYDELIDKGKHIVSYTPDLGIPQDELLQELFSSIHFLWLEEITRESNDNPFTDEEKSKLGNNDIRLAYGCTLIVCVKTSDFLFAFQIGDGRLFSISCCNEWTQPVPWDSACEDNITTSLCEDNPVERFRYYIDSRNAQPYAIFMCSDGIEDCYSGSHDGNFSSEKLIVDYSEVLRCFLEDSDFEDSCCGFLDKQSKMLSHDDMSIAFVIDDVYNIESKWLRLSKLRRLTFDIESKLDSFSDEIKDLEGRISNINSNIKFFTDKINELESNKDKLIDDREALEQKQNEERACAESATRFNAKISNFQKDIKEYCDEFKTNLDDTESTKGFIEKLIKYVVTALNKALEHIRQDIKNKRDNDTRIQNEIDQLNKEINKIESNLDNEKNNKNAAEQKLKSINTKKSTLVEKEKSFKWENSPSITKYAEEAKGIKERILQSLPCVQDNITDEGAYYKSTKTVNICKMLNGSPIKDITIEYSQHDISGSWNGDGHFQIPKEKFDEIIKRIKGINSSLFLDSIAPGECIAILLPGPEKSEIRYISLSEQDAIDVWDMCMALGPK